MPVSNSTMIHKLQNAINQKFDDTILYNKQQWYSQDQKRPVTSYIIRKAVYDNDRGKYVNLELFKTCSQIQVVLFLRDYWYELNGWDVPHDNEMWEKAKKLYYDKQEPNNIEPVIKGKKKGGKRNGKMGNK